MRFILLIMDNQQGKYGHAIRCRNILLPQMSTSLPPLLLPPGMFVSGQRGTRSR